MLKTIQRDFLRVINEGPNALNETLFDQPIDRVLLGLKAHANTINHARLTALEQTFPLTRRHIKEAAFNRLCRTYVETDAAKACDNNSIGSHFPAFLEQESQPQDAIELAQIEWAWLCSYHAADADALTLEAIAKLTQEALVALEVMWHPATAMLPLTAPLSQQLAELTTEEALPAAILSVRPKAEVQLLPLNAATMEIAQRSEKNIALGNLLAIASELQDMIDPIAPILTLIGAGALIAKEE
jgi:hypothetical protein